jgi:sodium-dependent dicarboxylate transporter 2/3/5
LLFPVTIPADRSASEHLQRLKQELGTMSSAEKRVAMLFGLVVLSWILRRPMTAWLELDGLSDTGIVMAAAILLFIIPSGDDEQSRLMVWRDISDLPWGVLILFGGGLSLAAAFSSSGLAEWLGTSLTPIAAAGFVVLLMAATAMIILLTELTSNLATTATMLPVVSVLAVQLNIDPIVLLVPVTLATSCAFMLPVATPPNAIVYSSGMITIGNMMRAGLCMNLLGFMLLIAVTLWWVPLIWGKI